MPLLSFSVHSLDQAKAWLNHGLQSHTRCKIKYSSFGPSRLLEVNGGVHHPGVKPITTPTQVPKYPTLSHCWGKHQPIMTKKENLASFQDEVPWKIIPQTPKDAIILVLQLGYRHLWIDSLCIIQDDSLDWERESSKMSDVYANSALTIYAA